MNWWAEFSDYKNYKDKKEKRCFLSWREASLFLFENFKSIAIFDTLL